jgi:hypothetical protein
MPDGPESKLTLLERREVEAKVVGPLVRGFEAAFGREATLRVVREVVAGLARESGKELAGSLGDATLGAFRTCISAWNAGGALEMTVIEANADRLDFDVTRCRYAEMYRALGLEDLGGSLSCVRDFALVEGFNPDLELVRTQTLMEGATHCDFRFRRREGPAGPS